MATPGAASGEDAVQKLESFLGVMAATRDQLQESSNIVDQLNEDFDTYEDKVEAKVGGFNDKIDEFTDEFEKEFAESGEKVDALSQLADAISQGAPGPAIAIAFPTLEERLEELEEEITKDTEADTVEVEASFEASVKVGGFELVASAEVSVSADLQLLTQEATSDFTQMTATLATVNKLLSDTSKTTIENLRGAHDGVGNACSNKLEEGFEAFTTAVGVTSVTEMTEGVSEVLGNLTEAFDTFDKGIEEAAEELMSMAAEILAGSAKHVGQEVSEELQEAVEEAIREFIEMLIADMAESFVMMQVGASTTTALSPYLPQLAAAKIVVGTINDLLDALNPFD